MLLSQDPGDPQSWRGGTRPRARSRWREPVRRDCTGAGATRAPTAGTGPHTPGRGSRIPTAGGEGGSGRAHITVRTSAPPGSWKPGPTHHTLLATRGQPLIGTLGAVCGHCRPGTPLTHTLPRTETCVPRAMPHQGADTDPCPPQADTDATCRLGRERLQDAQPGPHPA